MENSAKAKWLQWWINLPKYLKNCEPRYRHLRKSEIPIVKSNENLTIKVISGKSYGVESLKELTYTPIHYYDFIVNKKKQNLFKNFKKHLMYFFIF